MMKFYDATEGTPQYIKIIEDAQAQAERATLPISNDVLAAISNRVMLASNNYPGNTKRRNKLQ